jgi:mannose-1-phosphate guanylyltransferase
MNMRSETWAIVLAAGDGTRLSALTTDARGEVVPKQFCSLSGGRALMQEALGRAARIAPRERICAIVARRHARHWRHLLWSVPARNIIVQPCNCGTAVGVLLCVLHILERDPLAHIVFLPADHYVKDEALLADSVRAAARLLTRDRDRFTLVGVEPDYADPELGYIVPGEPASDGSRCVARFVEKPTASTAGELIALGAVWNSFIFAAHARALLAVVQDRQPEIVAQMASAFAQHRGEDERMRALDALYQRLPVVDFSRAIMQGAESVLRVCIAPCCGWADLGTPQRVALTLLHMRPVPTARPRVSALLAPVAVDLSIEVANLQAISRLPGGEENEAPSTTHHTASGAWSAGLPALLMVQHP